MSDRNDEQWEELSLAREKFIQALAKNIYLYGISPSIGRLYGTVLFSEAPMTLDQMSKALEMSKTSMSTGIRTLSEANMVEKVWQKGTRKDLYQAEKDWYKSFSTVFVKRWRNSVDNNFKAVREMRQTLTHLESSEHEEIRKAVAHDLEKLEHAQQYYEWLQKVIHLFESEEIYDIVPIQPEQKKE